MSGSFLLDTNIAIAFLEGELAIVDRVTQTDSVLLSSTIVGELYYGAFKSGRVTSNIERVEVLVQRIPVLDCDRNTAKVYGQIKNQLRQKGRPPKGGFYSFYPQRSPQTPLPKGGFLFWVAIAPSAKIIAISIL